MVREILRGKASDPELTGRLRSIEAEALLIWGELDGLAPLPQAEQLQAALPNSRLAVVEGAAHLPMVEKRETFHRLCHNFLTEVDEELPGVRTSP